MSVLTLDLLRHGDAENAACYRGRTDSALTPLGWRQMQAYAHRNPGWQQLMCSPLRRCAEPGTLIAEQLQLPVVTDDRLLELDFGDWEGRSYEDVWQQDRDAVMAFWQDPNASPPPGGESLAAFCARLQALEDHLMHLPALAQGSAHVLLLTHGGVIRGLLGRQLELAGNKWSQLRIDTGSLSRLKIGYDRQQRWCELSFMNWQPGLDSFG